MSSVQDVPSGSAIEGLTLWDEDLATPALVIDRDVLTANIQRMADKARSAGVALWPHAKTHKSTEIAMEQLAAGAEGITVATIAEAEAMAAAGVRALLLAYPPVDRWRMERLIALAVTSQLTVTVDDLDTVGRLDSACAEANVKIGYLWEVDCGNRRCGSPPGAPTAELVERAVARASSAEFRGLMTFPGHAYGARDDAALRTIARAEVEAVRFTAAELERRGIRCQVLSIGSTPTVAHLPAEARGMQIRPGNYVFNDATQVALGVAALQDCALSVLTTVISRPSAERLIFDAGSKALSGDRMSERTEGFGIVSGMPDIQVTRLFEEHAIALAEGGTALEMRSRARIIPNHACTATNLHSSVLLVEDEAVIATWPIAARGWGLPALPGRRRSADQNRDAEVGSISKSVRGFGVEANRVTLGEDE
jgi:D-serine deaminase-like pyridoxal phosphate-dependent protein